MKTIQTFNQDLKVDEFFVPITIEVSLNDIKSAVYVEARSSGSKATNKMEITPSHMPPEEFALTLIKEVPIIENTIEELRLLLNKNLHREKEIALLKI